MPYWYNFAIMFEALFILTTVDAGTRVARFIIQEMGSYAFKPLGRQNWLPGIIGASFVVVAAWGFLIFSGSISTIWPMFGVANQLLAAIALGVGTTVILKAAKKKYALLTFIPMLFMFVMTLTAAWQLAGMYVDQVQKAVTAQETVSLKLDISMVVFMAFLAVIVLLQMLYKWHGIIFKTGRKNAIHP